MFTVTVLCSGELASCITWGRLEGICERVQRIRRKANCEQISCELLHPGLHDVCVWTEPNMETGTVCVPNRGRDGRGAPWLTGRRMDEA